MNCSIKRKDTPYIVAHRGTCGANIPCNSLASFEAAIRQGADAIELDVTKSKDGELFIFHPGMEFRFLKDVKTLKELTAKEIKELRLLNQDGVYTSYRIPTLYEALSLVKDRAYVNVDKFWTDPGAIGEVISSLGMKDQVIVKAYGDEKSIDAVEKYAPEYMFMAMLRKEDKLTATMKDRKINYIGVESLFDDDNDSIISDGYIRSMHEQGYLIWVNGIVYDERDVISAGHNDDISVSRDPELGWGWLMKKNPDFIQTDWVGALKNYMMTR
ncbi:MAG: glycerophosphodiester phosphodiesterase family protein [Clostridia bacterium]|nr:glycerophosphodiester phosphodiesterase family protein [Clostridia bacterium]